MILSKSEHGGMSLKICLSDASHDLDRGIIFFSLDRM
jgi:hypothetical protein